MSLPILPQLSQVTNMRYLKKSGKRLNVKVTIRRVLNEPIVIYMRDFEFYSFHRALLFLRQVSDTEFWGIDKRDDDQEEAAA